MAETLSVLECPKPSIQGPHFNFTQNLTSKRNCVLYNIVYLHIITCLSMEVTRIRPYITSSVLECPKPSIRRPHSNLIRNVVYTYGPYIASRRIRSTATGSVDSVLLVK